MTTSASTTSSTSLRVSSISITRSLDGIADQRTGHAVPAAATLAQLEALDGDDLDPGLAHLGDRVGVALVGDDHAGLERDDVVAVVPLLALLLVGVAAGLDPPQLGYPQGVGHRGQEAFLLGDVELSFRG